MINAKGEQLKKFKNLLPS